MTSLKLITAPTTEPVSLAEAKLHLRVDGTADDALITALITAARLAVENFSRRALITQAWILSMDRFPGADAILLPRPPLQNGTGTAVEITYKLADGTEQTYSAANYVVDTVSEPGRIRLVSTATWPGDELYPLSAVTISFTAGYGAAEDVPQIYKQAMLLLIGHWYENREQVTTTGAVPQEIPMGVEYLLWPERVSYEIR